MTQDTQDRPTLEEVAESLTGFDEIAIKTHFGFHVADETAPPTMYARALIFVHQTRQGLKTQAAKDAALGMTLKDVGEYFADDEEVTPDEPATESGKDA